MGGSGKYSITGEEIDNMGKHEVKIGLYGEQGDRTWKALARVRMQDQGES